MERREMRNEKPEIHALEEVRYPSMSRITLKNQIPLEVIPFGPQEFVRLDVVFGMGTQIQPKFFVASFMHKLMREGTLHHSSKQIAEKIDFYGASLTSYALKKHIVFSLVVLEKHLSPMVELMREIFVEPTFPESEFELQVQKDKQDFIVNESKVTTMANCGLRKAIYGADGTFGKSPSSGDFDKVSIEDVKQFYNRYFAFNDCRIFLSGNSSDEVLAKIDETFGSISFREDYLSPEYSYNENPEKERIVRLRKEDSVQSAVCIGGKLFPSGHEDYFKFSVLNTVFGGYFGSRLMSNIREDKGYTYGIQSALSAQGEEELFVISSQTANEYVEPLLTEVYKEMEVLKEELVPEGELTQVRNYVSGSALRVFDGSFLVVDYYVSLALRGVDISDYYSKKIKVVNSVTAEELREMARRYFNKELFYEVVAGA